MRANVNVQDRVMRVPQGCSRLRDMPVSGAVCQPRAPDSSGRVADQEIHRGKRDGEAQEAAEGNEGGTGGATHDASATGESGAWERRGKVGWDHGDLDATGGRQGDGGRRSRI